MGYKLLRVEDDLDFYELARVEREAYESPYETIIDFLFPIGGPKGISREDSIKEAAERQIRWHHADPTSVWLKVVDEVSGNLLGAALWHVFENDPYAIPSEDECDWFDEGEERNIANGLMLQLFTPRMTYMRGPHLFLDILFTAPTARQQGVASTLLKWGIEEADKRNYATYIDSSAMARSLYTKHGLIEGRQWQFSIEPFEETEKLKEMEKRFFPATWWSMYRPAGGTYVAGKTALPWEASASQMVEVTA